MRHNKFGLLALTALTLTGMSALAHAQDNGGGTGAPQQGGGRGGRGGAGGFGGAAGGFGGGQRGQFGPRPIQLSDLSVATMDYGLKLTADQKASIQTILTQKDAGLKALPAPARPMPGQQMDDAARQAMQDARQKRTDITTKANTDIQAVLTDDQKAKLPDFTKDLQTMQQAGIPIAILGDLKLTDGQKKKIVAQAEQGQTAMQEKRRAAFQPGGQRPTPEQMQGMMTDMQAMQKDNADKIMALLTPTQHAMIDDYNRAHPQPAFGAGGPGGGFGGPGGGGFGGGRRGNGPGAGQGNGGAGGN